MSPDTRVHITMAILILTTLLLGHLFLYIFRRRADSPSALFISLLMGAGGAWAALNAVEYTVRNLSLKFSIAGLQYLAIACIGPFWLGFARAMRDEEAAREPRRLPAWIWVVPGLTAILVAADPALGLVRSSPRLVAYGSYTMIEKEFGPWFWVHSAYTYILLAVGTAEFLTGTRSRSPAKRLQLRLVMAGAFLPGLANILYMSGLLPTRPIDPTPLAFLATGLIMVFNLSNLGFLALASLTKAAALDKVSDAVLTLDQEGRLAYMNSASIAALDLKRRDVGRRLDELGPSLAELAGLKPGRQAALRVVRVDGRELRLEASATALTSRSGRPKGMVIAMRDATARIAAEEALRQANRALELKVEARAKALEESNLRLSIELESRIRSERQLAFDALHDPLTGLANRSLFLSRLEQALSRSRREGGGSFAVLYISLDGFPGPLGRFDHETSDAFLREAATRMRRCVREVDTVARIRGEEFAILLDGGAEAERAEAVAERLAEEVGAPFPAVAGSVLPSLSIGVLTGTSDHGTAHEVLRDADIAMHAARSSGRNRRVAFMEEMRRLAFERDRLMNDLRTAIVSGEIRLAYQPIVRLDGSPAGWECLARWHHPELGGVGPDRFIPLAEETGLIVPLGTFALLEAMRAAKSLIDEGLIPIEGPSQPFFAVNISPYQLRQPDFAEVVLSSLERSNLPPSMIHLELTESALIEDRDAVISVMRRLAEAGLSFKLDDFGTGYSSLGYLHRIPIDCVKIDRSFIVGITPPSEGNLDAVRLVRGIVTLGQELGKTIVAEGVETAFQAETLAAMGCDFAQGYYYGIPLEATQLREALKGEGCDRT